jgi:hypothetical protein
LTNDARGSRERVVGKFEFWFFKRHLDPTK